MKAVHVRPWIEVPVQHPQGWRRRLKDALHKAIDPNYPQIMSAREAQLRLSKHLQHLTDVIRPLSRVSEYTLEWDESSQFFPEFFNELLRPSLVLLGNRLVKISLKVPPAKLGKLVSLSLPHLEELHVQMCTGEETKDEVSRHLDGFIVFTNNLFRSLRVLKVSTTKTSKHLDVSSFFHRLGTFRRLVHFSLLIPITGLHLSNKLVLARFIEKHAASLEYLELGSSSFYYPPEPSNPRLQLWAQETLQLLTSHRAMVNLRTLQLGTRPLWAPLSPVQQSLRYLSPQLRSLSLIDRDLLLSEVVALLGASTRITSLTIAIKRLSPELLEKLASRLPMLHNLELRFKQIIGHEDEDADVPPGNTADELVGSILYYI